MKRLLSSLLFLGLVVGTFGGGIVFSAEKKPKVINIGCSGGGGTGKPFTTGTIGTVHARGLLEEEFRKDGITINWNFIKGGGPAVNEAVANGVIDFAYLSDFASIVGKASGLKTKYIAGSALGEVTILIPSDSSISSIKGLKGKRIGVLRGASPQAVLIRILEANGLTEKDVRLYDSQEIDAALASKDIDAGLTGLRARDVGIAKVLYSTNPQIKAIVPTKDFPDKWRSAGALVTTEKFSAEYPEITKRVVKAYIKAARWGAEEKNRNELFRLWSQSGTPYSALKEQNQGRNQRYYNWPLIDQFLINHHKDVLAFALERNLAKDAFDVDKWVDTSYQEWALKELGLENFWPRFDARGHKEKIDALFTAK